MEFRTRITIAKNPVPISFDSEIVSIGSCFAVNIAEKFQYFKFQTTTNPFGILFHPLALEKFLRFAIDTKEFSKSDIFFHNSSWHCFDAHSDLSNARDNILIDQLNQVTHNSNRTLNNSTHLIITLGTAWAYRNTDSGEIVANCHKVPQNQFKKELLSVETITQSLTNIVAMLKKINPRLQIIFTISPVRHIKDGFIENQRSKSHLFTALHAVLDANPELNYFPSYEIIIDELRDYRFYSQDMLHPSQPAIDYIWKRFSETYISVDASATMQEIDGIQRGLAHRPFNEDSPEHHQFLQNLNSRIDTLQQKYPHITF